MRLSSLHRSRAQRPPGPKTLPVLGSAVALARDPLRFLERLVRDYGDVSRFRIPGQTIYLFQHPDAIERLLVEHKDALIKDKLTRELTLLLGRGLLVSEGELWKKQRRLIQPGFHRDRIATYGDTMVACAERLVATFRDGEERDVHREMMQLTLDIVQRTLFGVTRGETQHQISEALETLMGRFSGAGVLIPPAVPTPGNIRAKKAVSTLDAIIFDIIRQRREDSGDDLLSMLIAATDDQSGKMSDTQLRDEALTLLLAGHETTALTLGFALHSLASHPETFERLATEISEVLGDRRAMASDLPRLTYAEAVIRESMRLFPPAWAVGREATREIEIAGYVIPKGTQLWAAQWTTQRDARWFPDPLAFKPERWEGGLAKALPRYAYFPFGGGPRICIGNAFAMMEAVLVLVTTARHFRFTNPKPLSLTPSVTLRPKHGLPMSLVART